MVILCHHLAMFKLILNNLTVIRGFQIPKYLFSDYGIQKEPWGKYVA